MISEEFLEKGRGGGRKRGQMRWGSEEVSKIYVSWSEVLKCNVMYLCTYTCVRVMSQQKSFCPQHNITSYVMILIPSENKYKIYQYMYVASNCPAVLREATV